MELPSLEIDLHIFVTNSILPDVNSQLIYKGTLSSPIFNPYSNLEIFRSRFEKLEHFLYFIEGKQSNLINNLVLITPISIYSLNWEWLTKNWELKLLLQLDDFSNPNLILSNLIVNNSSINELKKEKLDYLNLPKSFTKYISFEIYILYKELIEAKQNRNFLELFFNKSNETSIDLKLKSNLKSFHNNSSFIKIIKIQILDEIFNEKFNFSIEFQIINELLKDLSPYQMNFLNLIITSINKEFDLHLKELTDYVNSLFYTYLFHFTNIPDVTFQMINEVYYQLISIEFQNFTLSNFIFNLINTYSGILEEISGFTELYSLYTLVIIHIMVKDIQIKVEYGFLKVLPIHYLDSILQNFYTNFTNNSSSGYIDIKYHPSNIISNLHDVFQKLIKRNDTTFWNKFALQIVINIPNMFDFLIKLKSKNTKINIYSNMIEFQDHLDNNFQFSDVEIIDKFYQIYLLFNIIVSTLFETEFDPHEFLLDGNIFDYISNIINSLEKKNNNIEVQKFKSIFEKSYFSLSLVSILREFRDIIFDEFPIGIKFSKLIEYFDSGLSNQQFTHYFYLMKLRTLNFIINHLNNNSSGLIHRLLDIFELRQVNEFNKSTALIKLIRAYLNGESLDDETIFYLSQFFDLDLPGNVDNPDSDPDFEHLLLKYMDILRDENTDDISIDLDDLVMKMKSIQETTPEDNVNLDDILPPIPLDFFDYISEDSDIRDYIVFFSGVENIKNILENNNNPSEDDFLDYFYSLLNLNPYAEQLQPLFDKLNQSRQNQKTVVDEVQFELLKLKILAKTHPAEALFSLERFVNELTSKNVKPLMDDYRIIIQIFQDLEQMGVTSTYPYDLREQQLDLYEQVFKNFYELHQFIEVVDDISFENYDHLQTLTKIEPLIHLLLYLKNIDTTEEDIIYSTIINDLYDRQNIRFEQSKLVELLLETFKYQHAPDDLIGILPGWSQFPSILISIIDDLSIDFDQIVGLTEFKLILLDNDKLDIEKLYEILVEDTHIKYQIRATKLAITYFVEHQIYSHATYAMNMLIEKLYNKTDTVWFHEGLMQIVIYGKQLAHTKWFDLTDIIYTDYAAEAQLTEYDKVKKKDVEVQYKDKISDTISSKELNLPEDIYLPLVEYFDPIFSDNIDFIEKFLPDTSDETKNS